MWQIDCETYQKVGGTFQLRDVTTDEHQNFVAFFAARYNLTVSMDESTASFSKCKDTGQKSAKNSN